MKGEVICTPHGMIGVEKPDVEAYRKQYVGDILKSLQNMNTKEEMSFLKPTLHSEKKKNQIFNKKGDFMVTFFGSLKNYL